MSYQPEDHNQNKKTPIPLTKSISDGLKWISERSWPLSCILLFVSILFLYQFIGYYKIPISITSPTFITSLPVIFGFLVFFIFSTIGFLFSPAMILLTPISKKDKSKIIDKLKGKNILIRWVFFYMLSGSLIYLNIEFIGKEYYSIFIIWLIPSILTILIFKYKLEIKIKEISAEFYMATIFSSFFQIIVTLVVLLFIINITSEDLIYLKLLTTCLTLAIIQIMIAKIYKILMDSEKNLNNITITSFLIIVIISLQPYAAALLTSKVLEFTITGGRSCVVLALVDDFPQKNLIHDPTNPMHSINLRVFIETDGVYMVRQEHASNDSAVHFIPRSLVSSMDSCAKEAPQTPTPTPAPTPTPTPTSQDEQQKPLQQPRQPLEAQPNHLTI